MRHRRNIGGGLLSWHTREQIRQRDEARAREQLQSRKRVTGAKKVREFLDEGESRPRKRGMSAERHDVELALRQQGYSKSEARKKAVRASGEGFEQLFRSAMKGNPMKKSRNRKKRNRKGVMPPGLKRYWAKMRAKKNPKKRKRKKAHRNTGMRNFRKRSTIARNNVKRSRRRPRRNPSRRVRRITLPAMSAAATKKVVGLIKRLNPGRHIRVK